MKATFIKYRRGNEIRYQAWDMITDPWLSIHEIEQKADQWGAKFIEWSTDSGKVRLSRKVKGIWQ